MKKILLFVFSYTDGPFPPKQTIFKKEVPEIIPTGTNYHPFRNELRFGVIQAPYKIEEEISGELEFQMRALFEVPFEKINQEEIDYIRKNMEKFGWTLLSDSTDDRD